MWKRFHFESKGRFAMDKFQTWAVVEVMGHKKFAGRVTEGPFGLVQIDVPEVTLSSGKIVPPFTKMLGAHAIYAMTPCTEETAKAFAKEFRSQAFQTYELPSLPAPKPIVRDTDKRDPEWDDDDDDEWDDDDDDWGDEDVTSSVDTTGIGVPATEKAIEEFFTAAVAGEPAWPTFLIHSENYSFKDGGYVRRDSKYKAAHIHGDGTEHLFEWGDHHEQAVTDGLWIYCSRAEALAKVHALDLTDVVVTNDDSEPF
jgi:hypothetical protein